MPVIRSKIPDICLLLITDDNEENVSSTIASVSKYINHCVMLDMSVGKYTQRVVRECIDSTIGLEIYDYPYIQHNTDILEYGLSISRKRAKWTLVMFGNEELVSEKDFSLLDDTGFDLYYIYTPMDFDSNFGMRIFKGKDDIYQARFNTLNPDMYYIIQK